MQATDLNILEFLLPNQPVDVKKRVRKLIKGATTQDQIYQRAFADRQLINAVVMRAVADVLLELCREKGMGLVSKETGEFVPV